MSKLRCHIAISLDGFVAGPNQSEHLVLAIVRGDVETAGPAPTYS